MFKARWYQDTAHQRSIDILDAGGHPLILLATGTGKTEVAGMLAATFNSQGKNMLFLAHRGFLLDQADTKISRHAGERPQREQGSMRAIWGYGNITASVQTLKGKRLRDIEPKSIDYIVVDECHRSTSVTYQNIFEHFSNAQRIGLTATGDRPDGKSLCPTFSDIALQYSLSQAIKEGFLSRITGKRVKDFDIDLSGLTVSNGDFSSEDEIGDVIEKYLTPIAENIQKELVNRKKVLLFMPNVHSSKLLSETMQALGMSADYVSGERKDNEFVLAKFKSGQIKYLCSCMLLSEGYDEPAIDCVVMLRPTLSRIFYSQAVGRGTRLSDGKKDLLLLEFTFNSERHQLVTAYELLADNFNEEMVNEARSRSEDDGDFLEELEEVERTFYNVSNIVNRSCSKDYQFDCFNPLDIGALLEVDVNNETEAWFNGTLLTGMITVKQKEILNRYMINTDGMTKATASELLKKLTKQKIYPAQGLVSDKQLGFLNRLYDRRMPDNLTRAAASILITKKLHER